MKTTQQTHPDIDFDGVASRLIPWKFSSPEKNTLNLIVYFRIILIDIH